MATKWKIDPADSEIQFKVKHPMFSSVTGYFKTFDLEIETEAEDFFYTKSILFTADINSITTNNEQQDTQLKSFDFFHTEGSRQLHFCAKKYKAGGDSAKLHGDLTFKGITKPITLNVEYCGCVIDAHGQTKAVFTVNGKISRKEFGLLWSAETETGSVVVSNDIKIHAEVRLIKQVESTTAN